MEKRKIEITIILMTFFLSLSIIFSFIAQSKLQNINLQSNSINMKLNQQIISTLKEEEVNQTRLNMQVGEYLDNWKDYEKECNLFNWLSIILIILGLNIFLYIIYLFLKNETQTTLENYWFWYIYCLIVLIGILIIFILNWKTGFPDNMFWRFDK